MRSAVQCSAVQCSAVHSLAEALHDGSLGDVIEARELARGLEVVFLRKEERGGAGREE